MGGDGWSRTGPYQQDLAAAFRQAQERELAGNDEFAGQTIEQLWQDEEWVEYILTGGTGTVLDQVRLVDPTRRDDGPFMRPLTDEEIRAWCPGARPTHDQWLAALASGALPFPGRAAGNCVVLYRDGEPELVGYWGTTAD
jgi:hypothetical protein